MILTNKNKRFQSVLKFLFKFVLIFFVISLSGVIFYRFVPVPYTPLMAWKSTSSLLSNGEFNFEKKWVPIEKISRPMQKAVIKAEDAKFYSHYGFDFEAIEKAMKYNKTHKKQKGASTISQQTAKNVFLWPSRSWLRKGMEVYFTVLIELVWSKERILEVYLNVIELGPGVYGVEAASQKYFHSKAQLITPTHAALIASVLPNPIKFKINKPSAYILKRQRKIMGKNSAVVGVVAKNQSTNKIEENAEPNSQEFFDIKFDNDDEGDGLEDNSQPAND